jgi:hypothetical protein
VELAGSPLGNQEIRQQQSITFAVPRLDPADFDGGDTPEASGPAIDIVLRQEVPAVVGI